MLVDPLVLQYRKARLCLSLVSYAATHGTEPNVVKRLAEGKRPFRLSIVDLEAEIR
jgi:hypothetical protein